MADQGRRAIACWVLAPWLAVSACGSSPPPKAAGSAADAPVVSVPGSRVRLRLPPGFCRPSRQLVLVNKDGIAVVIIEGSLPTEKAASDWFTGLREEMKKWASGPVETREIKKTAAAATLSRMSLGKGRTAVLDLVGDNGAFATVIATYDARLEKTVEDLVAAADLDARAPFDPLATLGLRLSDAAGFDLVSGPAPPVVLKESGRPGGATYSVAVLAPPAQAATPADALRSVIETQLATSAVELDPAALTTATVDGMPAAEVVSDDPGEDGAKIYVAALMDKGAIVLAKGRAGTSSAAGVERFARMTRSIRRVPDVFASFACP